MDRKRKAVGTEFDLAIPEMLDMVTSEMSDNDTSADTPLLYQDKCTSSNGGTTTSLSKLVQYAGAFACQNPAVTALLAMAAEDAGVASTISTLAILKRKSLENKQLPEYPLGLDAVSLKKLRTLQSKRNKLANEYSAKLREAKMDYQQKLNPLYQRINEIVADEGVPDFWLSALLGNTILDNEITEQDDQALKHLMNINCYNTIAPERSLKLEFVFDRSNPFFKNTVLTKVIYFKRGQNGYVVDRTEGTPINWKKGKCLNPTYMINGREQGFHLKSFFNFFKSSDEHDLGENWIATMELHDQMAKSIESVMRHAYTLYLDTKASGKLEMNPSEDEDAGFK